MSEKNDARIERRGRFSLDRIPPVWRIPALAIGLNLMTAAGGLALALCVNAIEHFDQFKALAFACYCILTIVIAPIMLRIPKLAVFAGIIFVAVASVWAWTIKDDLGVYAKRPLLAKRALNIGDS